MKLGGLGKVVEDKSHDEKREKKMKQDHLREDEYGNKGRNERKQRCAKNWIRKGHAE
jgi:hypothetical protein